MADDRTRQLQQLLDRMRSGDGTARTELLGLAYERLRLLARKMFHHDFPRLGNLHETDSILHEAVLRLFRALHEVQPRSTQDFLTFSAAQIRRVLLDMARQHGREHRRINERRAHSGYPGQGPEDAPDTNTDPSHLAQWSEFHHKVRELPDEEREVVDLYWYQGLTQAETAQVLGVHAKAVSRRWLSARLKLSEWLPQ
ncbi:MAG TPA: sigma-70 family RNA polymerase sigma factor [Gemmataceae bacterium]|nr:sigma-70 family RNA polymerase sigma factor [Gemmataceae bacterium]